MTTPPDPNSPPPSHASIPHSAFRIPHSDNPQSAIRNPQSSSPAPSEKHRVLRAAGLIGAITLLSRLTGLVRDAILAAIFGSTRTCDVFLTSFEISNITRRVLGEGALSSFIVPVMSERRHVAGPAAGWRLFNLAANVLLVIATVLTLAGMFFSREVFLAFGGLGLIQADAAQYIDLGAHLTRLMFPFVIGLTFGSVMMGACHTLRNFGPPALGSVMLNVSMIAVGAAALLLRPAMDTAAVWLGWSVLAGALLRVAIMAPALRRAGWRWRPAFDLRDPHLRRLLRMMVPGLLAIAISQVNLSVAGFFAMYLGEGVNTSIKMAGRLIQFPMALTASAAATAMLPQFSLYLLQGRQDELRDLMALSKRLEIVIMIPAILGLTLLGLPIIELIYQHGHWTPAASRQTYIALLCYAPGLLPLGWIRLLEPLFFARHDRVTPLKAAVLSMVTNVVLNWLLAFHSPLPSWGWGGAGLAIANTVAAYVNYLALAWWLHRVLERPLGNNPRVIETFLKSLLAATLACAAGMGIYYFASHHLLTPHNTATRAALLLPAIGIVAALHFTLVRLLQVPDSAKVTEMVMKRLRKN